MDKREYLRIVQVGTARELIRALREDLDVPLSFEIVDAKIEARLATKLNPSPTKKPPFRFGGKFFTKLSYMPAVSVVVGETRSQIRKTCYGFRCNRTGERVYLRIDPGSVIEFRDSPCGYLIGTRYLIPGIDRMKGHRWDKVNRKMTRLLSREGIIVTKAHVAKYWRSTRARCKLAKRLIDLRVTYMPMRDFKRDKWQRLRDEKANK